MTPALVVVIFVLEADLAKLGFSLMAFKSEVSSWIHCTVESAELLDTLPVSVNVADGPTSVNAVGSIDDARTVSEKLNVKTPVFMFRLNERNVGEAESATNTFAASPEITDTALLFISRMADDVNAMYVLLDAVAKV